MVHVAFRNWLTVLLLGLCALAVAGPARAANYYVSTTGNDSWPGTLEQPWRHVKQANAVAQAGDTVYVRGGTYVSSADPTVGYDDFWPHNSGAAGKPVTLKAYPGETPTMTGAGLWGTFVNLGWMAKQHLVIDGISFENTTGEDGGTVLQIDDVSHCVVRNCHFRTHTGTFIAIRRSNHVTVENCTFDTCGDPSGEGAGDAIYVCGSDYTLIQNNHFTRAGHAAIDFIDYTNLQYLSEYNIARNNVIEQHWGSGIGLILHSSHIVLEGNKVYYIGEGVTTYPKSGIMCVADTNIVRHNIIAWTSAGPVRDNALTFEGYRFGPVDQHSRDNCVYHNVIYKSGKEAVMVTQRHGTQVTRNQFLNNVVYYGRTGGPAETYIDPDGNYSFIFETYHAYPENKWAKFANGNAFHHNLLLHADATGDHPGEDPFITYGQEGWGHSLAWVQANRPEAFWGNIEKNPKFVNAEAGDFHLQASSPAIDAGDFLTRTTAAGAKTTVVPVGNANFFCDGFGLIPGDLVRVGQNAAVMVKAVDYAKKTLTVGKPISFGKGAPVSLDYQGKAPDMGAYEYGGRGE